MLKSKVINLSIIAFLLLENGFILSAMPIVDIGILEIEEEIVIEYEYVPLTIKQDSTDIYDNDTNLPNNVIVDNNDASMHDSMYGNIKYGNDADDYNKDESSAISSLEFINTSTERFTSVAPTEIYNDAKQKFILFMNNIKLVFTLVAFIFLSSLYYYYYMITHGWQYDFYKLGKNIIALQLCYIGMITVFCLV